MIYDLAYVLEHAMKHVKKDILCEHNHDLYCTELNSLAVSVRTPKQNKLIADNWDH